MNKKRRELFLMDCTRHGLTEYDALRLARLFATAERLAVAGCNGDWPCDNGERKVEWCSVCESGMVRSKMDKNGICESCRVDKRAKNIVWKYTGVGLDVSGDPRGWVFQLTKTA